jgi:hypothetical protein
MMKRALGHGINYLKRLTVWKKRPSTGWPMRSDEDVEHVRQVFIYSPRKSTSQASAGLQVP